jgi:hypothetical protein
VSRLTHFKRGFLKVMQFTIDASKGAEKIKAHRANLAIAVAQARMLDMAGWRVQITDRTRGQYLSDKFDELLKV